MSAIRTWFCSLVGIWLGLAGTAHAQTLVKDINVAPGTGSSHPKAAVVMNGIAYFRARNALGDELWRTDGSTDGTWLVKDVQPGALHSAPAELTVVGSMLFFRARVRGYGLELWVSDGTGAGTRLVKDIRAEQDTDSNPVELTAFNGRVYFKAAAAAGMSKLWSSNGTSAGTTVVAEIRNGAGYNPHDLTVMGGYLYFFANDGTHGDELWRTNGTATGTTLVADAVQGSGHLRPSDLIACGNRLFFKAFDPTHGWELWTSNGTASGTHLTKNIHPTRHSFPDDFTALGNQLIFTANDGTTGKEVWRSNGTTGGTILMRDIRVGSTSSNPVHLSKQSNGVIVFSANDGAVGEELWKTDGTTAGTALVKDIRQGVQGSSPRMMTPAFGSAFAFTVGPRLYRTDGTLANTMSIQPVSNPSVGGSLAAYGSDLLFAGTLGSEEPWLSNGTSAGTRLLLDINSVFGDSNPQSLRELAPRGFEYAAPLFFSATTPTLGREPWMSHIGSGTKVIRNINPVNGFGSGVLHVAQWKGKTWFQGSGESVGAELYKCDGTPSGTTWVADLQSNGSSAPQGMTAVGPILFFSAQTTAHGREPYVTEGDASNTLLIDLVAGSGSSNPDKFTAVGTTCFFVANNGSGIELFKSTGTVSTTQMVKDLVAGPGHARPDHLVAFGTKLIFVANSDGFGREVHVSDGTASGTKVLLDIVPGPGGALPFGLVSSGRQVFFIANSDQLWVTDGTKLGTRMLRDIVANRSAVVTRDIVGTNGRIYLFVDDLQHGLELWTSDGTAAGTVMVRDLMPGFGDGVVAGTLARLDASSIVAFAAGDGDGGLQLWTSDGTAAGTTQLGRFGQRHVSGAASIGEVHRIHKGIYAAVNDGVVGNELFVWAHDSLSAYTDGVGEATCRGKFDLAPRIAASGRPQLGSSSFAFDVVDTPEGSPVVVYLGLLGRLPVANGCSLQTIPAIWLTPVLSEPCSGFARTSLPIPRDSVFTGFYFGAQAAVYDPVYGKVGGAFTLSDGLEVFVGR